MNYVQTNVKDRIGYIILNRLEKRNALNAEFVNELKSTLKSYEDQNEVRAIVLKSSGETFCAGADLEYLQQLQNYTFEENLTDSHGLAALFKLIYAFPKPVITIVNGPAIAGGCGLATVGDFCFASPASTFGYTEARIGFIPAIVTIFLKKKVNETISKKLVMTGETFSAAKAFNYGLITEIVEPDIMDAYVHEWVVKLIHNSSSNSLKMIKEMYCTLGYTSLDEDIRYACYMNATARETDDCKKGISAFLSKQKISW